MTTEQDVRKCEECESTEARIEEVPVHGYTMDLCEPCARRLAPDQFSD